MNFEAAVWHLTAMSALHHPTLHNAGNAQLCRLGARTCSVCARFRNFIAFPRCKEEVLFQAVLFGVELKIPTFDCKQFVVSAALHDASRLNYQDLIRTANRRQAVRDDESRSPAH